MITKIDTEYGVINLNTMLLSQMATESVKSLGSKVKILPLKDVKYSKQGLYVRICLNLAFGESISDASNRVLNALKEGIENSLEMKIDNIEVVVENLITKSLKQVPRHIVTRLHD